MKPILFNTDMVRRLLNGEKTVTRRVVKPQPEKEPVSIPDEEYWLGCFVGEDVCRLIKPPYHPGDILYVRETWSPVFVRSKRYLYKADAEIGIGEGAGLPIKWHPSIHMPREAARIFLRVTDIKVQRVQDITDEEAQKEGVKGWMVAADRDWDKNPNFVIAFRHVWNNCYSKPQPVKVKGVIHYYESYPWEDIQETRTYRGKPWYVIGNPWVWVIEFERCEKPEGD